METHRLQKVTLVHHLLVQVNLAILLATMTTTITSRFQNRLLPQEVHRHLALINQIMVRRLAMEVHHLTISTMRLQ